MNICLVSRELYPFQKAGIGVYINNLAQSLITHGHKVSILTSEENKNNYYKGNTEGSSKLQVVGVSLEETPNYFKDYNFAYSFAVYNSLKKLCKESNFDLIEFVDYFGEAFFSVINKKLFNMDFNGIPFVMKLHTPTYECNLANQVEKPISNLTMQEDHAICNIDYVYAISHFMKSKIESRLGRTDIQVVYNMIDIPQTINLVKEDSSFLSKKYVLFVGRLEERKGIDLFIKAAVEYLERKGKVHFIIIGQDLFNHKSNNMMRYDLLELIPENLQKFFLWMDPMKQEELLFYYKNAYVSVFPSRFEGFGNVCAEAMKMGSPVIVSDQTAMMEIIDNGRFGVSFKNGDSYDLFLKIASILDDQENHQKLKTLAKERGDSFSLEELYPSQIKYYNSVIEDFKKNQKRTSESITEIVLFKTIEQVQCFFAENQRLTAEWTQLKYINDKYVLDIIDQEKENKRIMGEWKKGSDYIESLKKEISVRDMENERILNEWEVIRQQIDNIVLQNNNLLKANNELESYRDIQKGELFKLRNEVDELKAQIMRKEEELDILYEKIQNKKFLIKQLISGRGRKFK